MKKNLFILNFATFALSYPTTILCKTNKQFQQEILPRFFIKASQEKQQRHKKTIPISSPHQHEHHEDETSRTLHKIMSSRQRRQNKRKKEQYASSNDSDYDDNMNLLS